MPDTRTHYQPYASGMWSPRIPLEHVEQFVDGLPVEQLLATDVETLVSELADKVLQMPSAETTGPLHVGRSSARIEAGALVFDVHLPAAWWDTLDIALHDLAARIGRNIGTGACDCTGHPMQFWNVHLRAQSEPGTELDVVAVTAHTLERIEAELQPILRHHETLAADARDQITQAARGRIMQRVRLVEAIDTAHAALGISLTPTSEAQQVSLKPQHLGPAAFHARAATGQPLPTLVTEAREGVISTISSFATALESMPATARQLAEFSEEQLRDVLLFVLNANWRGQATGETFTNKGKTDISLFALDHRIFLAELKWWKGPKALAQAIDQLASYTIARDTAACLLVLYRDKNFTTMRRTAEQTIEQHPSITGRLTTPATQPSRFWLRSTVDDQRRLELVFLPVCLTTSIQ